MDPTKILELNNQMLEVAEELLDLHLKAPDSMVGHASASLLFQIKSASKASAVLLHSMSQQEDRNG